jgi:TRAP-type C4-dicarboxylate transport system permease small subunit
MAARSRTGLWRHFSFEGLLSGLNSLGTLWIIVLMVIMNIDVFGRTLFTKPLPGVPELVRLSIVAIIFIQIGHTLRTHRLTRSDNLIRALQDKWPRIGFGLQGLYALAGSALFAILFHASFPFFIRSWTGGEYAGIEGYVSYPVWPVRLIILIGCACAAIQYLLFAWRDFRIATGLDDPKTGADRGGGFDLEVLK